MPLKYLNEKSWSQVTREERYFCSHLYHFLKNKEKPFVKWLNNLPEANFPLNNNWEIAFEACFYRDFYKLHEIKKLPEKLRKRTYDLCLFSNNHIIIIEAKVQQAFTSKQLNSFIKDEIEIKKLPQMRNVKISKILLYASSYNFEEVNFKLDDRESKFYKITWKDLYKKYSNPIFNEADKKYKK